MSKQLPLTPEARLQFEEAVLSTSEFAPLEGLWPEDSFVESVRSCGILEPLIVERRGKGYRLLAGRRRLMAARKAGLESVPVRIMAPGSVRGEVVTLAENFHRKANPASEVDAIQALLKTTPDWRDIAEKTGMPVAKVSERIRLIELLPVEILDAFKAGKIAPSVAWAITKLTNSRKATLVRTLEKKTELTSADVRGVRAKRRPPAERAAAHVARALEELAEWSEPYSAIIETLKTVRHDLMTMKGLSAK